MATVKAAAKPVAKAPTKLLKKVVAAAPAEEETQEEEAAEEPAEEEVAEEAPKAKKTAVKTLTKTTAKTAPKADKVAPKVEETAEEEVVDSTDFIVMTAHEVENSDQKKALAILPRLINSVEQDYFKIGGYLAKVNAEGWHQDAGKESFKEYVEDELGINYRKAYSLISIYNGLVETQIPFEKVKHLGWTKLKELVPVMSAENVDDWVGVAEQMTVLKLIEYIKETLKGTTEGDNTKDGDTKAAGTVTMTFKLHEDQKKSIEEALDKAMNESNTQYKAVALENICMHYMAGNTKAKKMPSLKELMAKADVDEVLQRFQEVFPTIVLQAQAYETAEEAQEAQAELAAAQAAAEEEAAA